MIEFLYCKLTNKRITLVSDNNNNPIYQTNKGYYVTYNYMKDVVLTRIGAMKYE